MPNDKSLYRSAKKAKLHVGRVKSAPTVPEAKDDSLRSIRAEIRDARARERRLGLWHPEVRIGSRPDAGFSAGRSDIEELASTNGQERTER